MSEERVLGATTGQTKAWQKAQAITEWCRTRCTAHASGLEAEAKLGMLLMLLDHVPDEVLEVALRTVGFCVPVVEFRAYLKNKEGKQLFEQMIEHRTGSIEPGS